MNSKNIFLKWFFEFCLGWSLLLYLQIYCMKIYAVVSTHFLRRCNFFANIKFILSTFKDHSISFDKLYLWIINNNGWMAESFKEILHTTLPKVSNILTFSSSYQLESSMSLYNINLLSYFLESSRCETQKVHIQKLLKAKLLKSE